MYIAEEGYLQFQEGAVLVRGEGFREYHRRCFGVYYGHNDNPSRGRDGCRRLCRTWTRCKLRTRFNAWLYGGRLWLYQCWNLVYAYNKLKGCLTIPKPLDEPAPCIRATLESLRSNCPKNEILAQAHMYNHYYYESCLWYMIGISTLSYYNLILAQPRRS